MQINIDCEGPITQNDNAFELCRELIPSGGEFFARVSRYDDYLADVVQRRGYKAGDTLKLVLPFLKAFGATNRIMEEFSQRTLVLLPGAREMLPLLAGMAPTFIISTSYRPYLEALCKVTGFPLENCYCTDVDLDGCPVGPEEERRLRLMAEEIAAMPMLTWDESGRLKEGHEDLFQRLDEIFFQEIPAMEIGGLLTQVNPVGGAEKARSVEDGLKRSGAGLDHCLYFGDSITDTQAMALVGGGGGLACSFNGNGYALKAANMAAISGSTMLIAAVAQACLKEGPSAFMRSIEAVGGSTQGEDLCRLLQELGAEERLLAPLASLAPPFAPALYHLGVIPWQEVVERSERVRREVRGQGVGSLG